MREVLHLSSSDVRRVPWKNGRGVTQELALWPLDAAFERGDFLWRISKARLDEPGPFSVFADFDRILVVTEGGGLLLEHGDRAPRARVRRFEPYRFSGDWPTTCAIQEGPVADFNVLARRGECEASVQVLKLGMRRARETIAAQHAFVHVVTGSAIARVTEEEDPFALAPGESLWVRDPREGEEIDLAGRADGCVVLLVQIAAAWHAGA